jgi:hypothetical protein
MKNRKTGLVPTKAAPAAAQADDGVEALYAQIQTVLTQARRQAHRSVHQVMVQAYWHVGRLIVEHEQAGRARAAYGARVLQSLAEQLTSEFGEGFAVQSLRNFRQLYRTFPGDEIRSTPWSELGWSQMKVLMRLKNPAARQWYAHEAVAQTWSVTALDRQVSTLYYERLLSSQDQASVKAEAGALSSATRRPTRATSSATPTSWNFWAASPRPVGTRKTWSRACSTSCRSSCSNSAKALRSWPASATCASRAKTRSWTSSSTTTSSNASC